MPKGLGSISLNMTTKKKAMEIRYTNSASRLSFIACSLLNNQTRMVKQSLLETDDLVKRIGRVSELLSAEIEVIIFLKLNFFIRDSGIKEA